MPTSRHPCHQREDSCTAYFSISLASNSVWYDWVWLLEASLWLHVLSAKETRKAKIWQFPLLEWGWALPVSKIQKAGKSLSIWSTWQEKRDKCLPKSALPGIRPSMSSVVATEMCQTTPLELHSPTAWPFFKKGIGDHQRGEDAGRISFLSQIPCLVKLCCSLALSCVWLFCDPIDCRPPDSSVHGILQARTLEWVAISFSRRSSWPRDGTCICCFGRRILYH